MSTSKIRRYHHGQLRESLIALTVEMLETTRPEDITLRALATAAGVSAMAPYRHFADKAALLTAVAEWGFVELRAILAKTDDDDLRKALTGFATSYVAFGLEHPGLFRIMFGATPPTPDRNQEEDPFTVLGVVTARLASILPPDQQRIGFLTAWSTVHGLTFLLIEQRIRGPIPPLEQLVPAMAMTLFDGLLPQSQGSQAVNK